MYSKTVNHSPFFVIQHKKELYNATSWVDKKTNKSTFIKFYLKYDYIARFNFKLIGHAQTGFQIQIQYAVKL